ncbi:hypothetical protein FRB94_006087 [Tulasnella sp. JGI-2019a]|nr:hypothetical protein FRB93_013240 [Tulasnella sp. JGI-2019a]KAG8999575.1 hypothetical protein FRB94_006087 [Tulasnella sp. JGI-2019a]
MGEGGNITLVNATPYNWTLGATHSYQMAHWSFPAKILAGTSVSVYVEYKQGAGVNQKDDGGEAMYSLDGVNHTFQVQARSTSNSSADFHLKIWLATIATQNFGPGVTIDLGWAHNSWTTFVLSGDETNFSSTQLDASNWMQRNLGRWGDRQLRHFCIPGTHDAGMSVLDHNTFYSSKPNTVTQVKSIGGQLSLGSRYFDIRPCKGSGTYYTGHYSYMDVSLGALPLYKGWQGGRGQSIQDVIKDVNSFTDAHAELVILNLSHAYDTDTGNANYPDLTQAQWEDLLKELTGQVAGVEGLRHLYIAPASAQDDLTQLKLNDFVGGGKAAVVVVVPNPNSTTNVPKLSATYANQGFYTYSQVNAFNDSAGTNNADVMIKDQLTKMAENRPNSDASYFLLSWTVGLSAWQIGSGFIAPSPSILDIAGGANTQLPIQLMPACSKATYPNILYIDRMEDTNPCAVAVAINYRFGA